MSGLGFWHFVLFFGPIAAIWAFGMAWYVYGRRRRGLDIESSMREAGRFLPLVEFNRGGPRAGSLILEHADYESSPLAWWTPDDLNEQNAPPVPKLKDIDSYIPDAFSAWCMDHYLDRQDGAAVLVTASLTPWLRQELEEAHPGLRIYNAWTFPLHHGHRYVAPPELIVDDDGYHVDDAEHRTLDAVQWDHVKEIVAYKTDHYKHGEVCVAFRVDDDGSWHEISDASEGFERVTATMERQFPDIPDNWYEHEKEPHTEHPDTVLYMRLHA
ncbi:MAG: hypothetical protein ACYTGQ_02990 [Planctomycetota bacterium]|jgi:hypothetical protein